MTLPAEGSAVEKNRLDCKAVYADGPGRSAEMAKDVAAFANANGGRLLIGSDERGGILQKHVGLDPEVASKTRRAIEEAVRNFVRPAPVIDFPEPYRLPDGKVVLVVDVQPFPGQAVGVREGKQDGAAWAFPVRVGTQTVRYSPEQLVLLMDVAFRRKIQLLHLARLCGQVTLHNAPDVFGTGGGVETATIESIDEAGSSMRLTYGDTSIWLSVDVVESLWRTDQSWSLRLNGRLVLTTHRDQPALYFSHGRISR